MKENKFIKNRECDAIRHDGDLGGDYVNYPRLKSQACLAQAKD